MQKFNTKLNWTLPKASNKTKQPTPFSGKQVANTIFYVGNAKSWAPDIHKGVEDSTLVKSVDYDERYKTLTVVYRDGFKATYDDIEPEMAKEFIEDESKGRWALANLWSRKYR